MSLYNKHIHVGMMNKMGIGSIGFFCGYLVYWLVLIFVVRLYKVKDKTLSTEKYYSCEKDNVFSFLNTNPVMVLFSAFGYVENFKEKELLGPYRNLRYYMTGKEYFFDKEILSEEQIKDWGKNSTRPESCRKFVESSIF